MRTLFVAGASSDVGSALIFDIAERYDVIWAHYFHWNDQLEKMKNRYGDKIRFLQADVTNPKELSAVIDQVKREELEPDHVIYLPMAKNFMNRFQKTSEEEFREGYTIAVEPLVSIAHAFLPRMVRQKYGKFVVMLSSNVYDTPPKFQTAYVTAKYAQMGLIKSLASEYEEKGITFNGVSPDMIQTKFLSDLPHLAIEQYAASRPKKRLLTVDEVVPVFAFLLSPGADGITGENILIR